ncbi:MAG: hypothetical protein M1821_009382 [Bathelium mastoideum]|nr:MAG: hypothetical protein M1821_009382 [Bathelium mastoideum]
MDPYLTSSHGSPASHRSDSPGWLPALPASEYLADNYGYDTPVWSSNPRRFITEAPSPTPSLSKLEAWPWKPKTAQPAADQFPPSPKKVQLKKQSEKIGINQSLLQSRGDPHSEAITHTRSHPTTATPFVHLLRFAVGVLLGILIAALLHATIPLCLSWLQPTTVWTTDVSSGPSSSSYSQRAAELTDHSDHIMTHTSTGGQHWLVRSNAMRLGSVVATPSGVKDVAACIEQCEEATEHHCVGVNFVNANAATEAQWCELVEEWEGGGDGRFLSRLMEWKGGSCAERLA